MAQEQQQQQSVSPTLPMTDVDSSEIMNEFDKNMVNMVNNDIHDINDNDSSSSTFAPRHNNTKKRIFKKIQSPQPPKTMRTVNNELFGDLAQSQQFKINENIKMNEIYKKEFGVLPTTTVMYLFFLFFLFFCFYFVCKLLIFVFLFVF